MRLSVFFLVGVLVSAGCASSTPSRLTTLFVRQGMPALDLGGPLPSPKQSMPAKAPLADASITAGVNRSAGAASLESINSDLRSALARLMLAPTMEHHVYVARAYRRQGIFDQAYNYLTRSLTVNGPEPFVYDERARLWRDWGHPDLGLADAHRAVYLAPKWPAFRNTLGTLLYRTGNPEAAVEQFEQVLALEPDAWYALANLCHVNLARGNTRAAIGQCRRAAVLREKQAPKPRQKTRP